MQELQLQYLSILSFIITKENYNYLYIFHSIKDSIRI